MPTGSSPRDGRASMLKPAAAQSDLAHHIIAAMERKGYQIDRGQNEINIVYVEGMNPDGTPNDNEENKWNDLRLLIRFEGGEPRIIGKWAATTEPGRYYIEHPLNPGGAARVSRSTTETIFMRPAPIDLRMPISRVRSSTAVYIV